LDLFQDIKLHSFEVKREKLINLILYVKEEDPFQGKRYGRLSEEIRIHL